jgi:hypothetical protein
LSERSNEVGSAQVPTVCGRAGLLPPRIGEGTGIDAIESERIDEPHRYDASCSTMPSLGTPNESGEPRLGLGA